MDGVDDENILRGQAKVSCRRDIEPEHELDGSSGKERVLGRGYRLCKDPDVGRNKEYLDNHKKATKIGGQRLKGKWCLKSLLR